MRRKWLLVAFAIGLLVAVSVLAAPAALAADRSPDTAAAFASPTDTREASGPAARRAKPRRLRAPRRGARVYSPPVLVWARVRRATYYNVQLYRAGRKILSAWPVAHRLRLRRTWRYHSRRYRLVPARYRWYVWPGYGSRSRARYGRLLGTSYFRVLRPPRNTSPPKLTGSAREGETMAASVGKWRGTRPLRYAFRWRRCDAAGANCKSIAGATARTYRVVAEDIDHTLRARVTASNGRRSRPAPSRRTAVVLPAPPVNTSAPRIWGRPRRDSRLVAGSGSWASSRPITHYGFQWYRCSSTAGPCGAIRGATSPGYRLRRADVGYRIVVVVTAANAGGSTAAASARSPVVSQVLVGTRRSEVIAGSRGPDTIRARGGSDRIYGGGASD